MKYDKIKALKGGDKIEEKIELKDEERQLCEVWTRVMGYFRPVDNFNKGKISEFNERKYFSEKKAIEKGMDIAAE